MKIDVITIFPEMIADATKYGVIGRAKEKNLLKIEVYDLRDFAYNRHRSVDDYCYGVEAGMLLKPEPIFEAVKAIVPNILDNESSKISTRIILPSPHGTLFNHDIAKQFSIMDHIVIICGRYKGVDERVCRLVTDEISIGDYILSGGEIPALVIIDSISRLIPGVLGNYESAQDDSFSDGILDCPHYTRPSEFMGMRVPEVLLSGDPKKINEWQRKQALTRTLQRRPDLLKPDLLSEEDLEFLKTLGYVPKC